MCIIGLGLGGFVQASAAPIEVTLVGGSYIDGDYFDFEFSHNITVNLEAGEDTTLQAYNNDTADWVSSFYVDSQPGLKTVRVVMQSTVTTCDALRFQGPPSVTISVPEGYILVASLIGI